MVWTFKLTKYAYNMRLGFRHLMLEGVQCCVYQTYISKLFKKKGWREEGLWLSANENVLNYKFNGDKNTGKQQLKIRFKWGKKASYSPDWRL